MTREEIEQLNEVEPYCFETDREEQWYRVGLQEGLNTADENPKSPWISVEDDLPCNNPNNIHFGFTNNVLTIDDKNNTFITFMMKGKDNKWVWDSTDNFAFLHSITHWMPIPKLPKQ